MELFPTDVHTRIPTILSKAILINEVNTQFTQIFDTQTKLYGIACAKEFVLLW
jgi:hypothetical protein